MYSGNQRGFQSQKSHSEQNTLTGIPRWKFEEAVCVVWQGGFFLFLTFEKKGIKMGKKHPLSIFAKAASLDAQCW